MRPSQLPVRPASALLLSSVFLLVASCGTLLKAAGYPPQAMRAAPPEGLEQSAAAVGTQLAAATVPLSEGQAAPLLGAPTAIVFYRGQW